MQYNLLGIFKENNFFFNRGRVLVIEIYLYSYISLSIIIEFKLIPFTLRLFTVSEKFGVGMSLI